MLVCAERHIWNTEGKLTGHNRVRMWDLDAGTDLGILYEHSDEIQSLAVNSDGTLLATSSNDGRVFVWDMAEHRMKYEILHSAVNQSAGVRVLCATFAHHVPVLATASVDGIVRLWDMTTGAQAGMLLTKPQVLQFVSFSLDDRLIAAGGDDRLISLWFSAFPAGTRQRAELTLCADSQLWGAVFLDERRFVTTGRSGAVRRWDAHDLLEHRRIPGRSNGNLGLAFLGDGETLVCSGGTVQAIEVDHPERHRDLEPAAQAQSTAVSIASDGLRLAATTSAGKVMLWSTGDWSRRAEFQVSLPYKGVKHVDRIYLLNKGEELLLNDGAQKTFACFDTSGNETACTAVPGLSTGDALLNASGNSALAVVKPDGRVQFWRKSLMQWELPGLAILYLDGALSRDASRLAIPREDGSITVIETNNPNRSLDFSTNQRPYQIAFSSDARTLAVAGNGEVILIGRPEIRCTSV